jgi:hypothetical protein
MALACFDGSALVASVDCDGGNKRQPVDGGCNETMQRLPRRAALSQETAR